jgi:hypothetical protein
MASSVITGSYIQTMGCFKCNLDFFSNEIFLQENEYKKEQFL